MTKIKIKGKNFQKNVIATLVIAIVLAITIKMIIGRRTISTIETNTMSKVENNEEKENEESVNWVESADGKLVPVPKGYSGSQIEEEIAIFNLQKTVNQYVWVPVEDVTEIYGTDSKGKMLGKLYDSYGEGEETRIKKNWTINSNGIMNWIYMSGLNREPDVIARSNDYDTDRGLTNYVTGQTRSEMIAEEMERDFCQMVKSVEKYGGFYIGRYETGGLSDENVKSLVVRKMQTAISNTRWYTMYEACRNLKGTNKNVETSMIWGSLWDATLDWLVESGAETTEGEKVTNELLTTSSTKMGNFSNSTFNYIANGATKSIETEFKSMGSNTKIPTGSSEYTKVNNIYDMAGNVQDWTLETYGASYRIERGGYSYNYVYAAYRNFHNSNIYYDGTGVRALLLIN